MEGQMKLDFHVHCDKMDSPLVEKMLDTCRKNSAMLALSGGLRYGSHDYVPNEDVLSLCRKHSEFMIPVAKFDLWDVEPSPETVFKYKESGFRALKLIYPYHEYDHDMYMPVYEAAEKCGIPLLFHTGTYFASPSDAVWKRPVLKNMRPLCLDRIARSFPKLNIVMAHMGTSIYRHEAAELLRMHPNLYFDLAGSGSWMTVSPEELVSLLKPLIPLLDTEFKNYRRLIFGSDAYMTHPHLVGEAAKWYEMICAKTGLPQDIVNGIMGNTAAAFMGIKL